MLQVVGASLLIILFISGWWSARFIFRQNGRGSQFLTASTLAWSWCILGMQVLGSFSLFTLAGIEIWAGLGLAIAVGARCFLKTEPVSELELKQAAEPPLSWPGILCLTFLIWVCLEMTFQSLLYPVKVMSDGPIYHLYFAVRWWKAGKFLLIAAPFGENAATYFPANGDLWFTWLMIAWNGDRLARIGQTPFLIIAGVAAYRISRTLAAGRSASVIATTWFLTSSALLIFSFEANVDTIFIANYLLAAYFWLRFARGEDGKTSLLLGGLAAGGALGTKSVAIVFIPPLILLALIAALMRPGSLKIKVERVLILLMSPLVLSGYWFFQNTFLTGNPLYPLRVELLGTKLLTGWYGPGAMERSQYYIPVTDWRAFVDILLTVIDPRLAPIWFLAVIGAWTIPRPAHRAEARWIWLFACMAVVNLLLYWLVIPYRSQQRFMFHALGLMVVPLAQMFDRGKWIRAGASLLLVLHVVTPQYWPIVRDKDQPIPWDLSPMIPNAVPPPLFSLFWTIGECFKDPNKWIQLVFPLALGLLCGVVAWSWSRRFYGDRIGRLAVPLASALVLGFAGSIAYSPGSGSPRQLFYPPFKDFYRGWMELDSAAGPNGSRVAYAGTNIPYFLFGAGLRNDVLHVNVDEHRNWLLHDYHLLSASKGNEVWPNSRPGWDRMQPDYSSWLANLEAERIKLLVVTKINTDSGPHNAADTEGFPIERQWADMHPERFQLLYGAVERDPWFRLYRLIRPKGAEQ